jgi:hypothetical protein
MRWYLSETEYPAIRRVMGPDRERMSDEAIESVVERVFPGGDAGLVEDWMSALQQFGKQAAPIVQRVAPAMAQGAVSGASVGGPWGAVIGGLGGGAASLLSGGLGGGGSAAPKPPAGPAPAPAPVAVAAAGAAPAPGNSGLASGQLLTLLSRPETMQALLALLMGQSGRSTVPVGQHQVPAAAFANAISELAGEAALEPGGASGYWYDPRGAARCDLADPRARAALLWRDVADAADAEAAEAESDEAWVEADAGDGLDSFEAALAGEYDGD